MGQLWPPPLPAYPIPKEDTPPSARPPAPHPRAVPPPRAALAQSLSGSQQARGALWDGTCRRRLRTRRWRGFPRRVPGAVLQERCGRQRGEAANDRDRPARLRPCLAFLVPAAVAAGERGALPRARTDRPTDRQTHVAQSGSRCPLGSVGEGGGTAGFPQPGEVPPRRARRRTHGAAEVSECPAGALYPAAGTPRPSPHRLGNWGLVEQRFCSDSFNYQVENNSVPPCGLLSQGQSRLGFLCVLYNCSDFLALQKRDRKRAFCGSCWKPGEQFGKRTEKYGDSPW